MALSKKELTASVKKFKPILDAGKTIEEVATAISVDENGYEEDEVTQVVDALKALTGEGTQNPPSNNSSVGGEDETEQPENPLAVLAEIDYKNLKGESFKKYVELVGDRSYTTIDTETGKELPVVGKLRLDEEHVFEAYKAKPIFKDRFPGIKDSPKDFIGVELVKDAPLHKTKIPVATALELNSQITNGHSRAGHGTYYLIKK